MNKAVSSPAEAVADIVDGATIGIAGFGVAHRFPSSLITALRDWGAKRLTVYCHGLGQPGHPTAHLRYATPPINGLCAPARLPWPS